MHSASKPLWQQMTALVSLSAGGAVTGFSFAHGTPADMKSPSSMPIRLLALEQSVQRASSGDTMLRSAIINVANYYLHLAATRTPAEMEALIWQHDSIDGVDHGASCAAFASLTLELAAQVVGQQSWVTGGTTYPWPLHKWADVRVDPNPASLGVTSILQDAQAHHRWHPLGDGYQPLPGDWVMFDGHVEVVTKYAGGVLYTIGGDSLPNFSVNTHQYSDPLTAQGVTGFVNNGALTAAASEAPGSHHHRSGHHQAADHAAPGQAVIPGTPAAGSPEPSPVAPSAEAAIPGMPVAPPSPGTGSQPLRHQSEHGQAGQVPGASPGAAAIPGLPVMADGPAGLPASPHHADAPSAPAPAPPAAPGQATSAERAFISKIAPGAIAAQRKYGVPASVTIAQAIDESGWGRSALATRDHNLFGIKGTGPAGSDRQLTQEYLNGQLVTRTTAFRVYHSAAQSIDDHGRLLATSAYYRQSMAHRHDPNAFAAALTGVYATDPGYGAKLIDLMHRYDLYRYDSAAQSGTPQASPPAAPTPGPTTPTPGPTTPTPRPTTPPAAPTTSLPATPRGEPAGAPGAVTAPPGGAVIPGLPDAAPAPAGSPSPPAPSPSAAPGRGTRTNSALPQEQVAQSARITSPARTPAPLRTPAPASGRARKAASHHPRTITSRYQLHIPPTVRTAFVTAARVPLMREEPLYRDVASYTGVRWELLAACDWMQCEARPRYSPVHGEKLGTKNPDGTVYRTRSEALEQCANDMVELARAVYRIELTDQRHLSVGDLANVFAAFRWGGLLKLHHTSAMEFPYSVAGLTAQHINMRWPNIAAPNTPDKPGGRFRMPFGAVPIVLCLNYPAID